jgi:FdhD protein
MADLTAKTQSIKRVDKVIYSRSNNFSREVKHDSVITEQPLQIILHWYNNNDGIVSKVYAITMRTLGNEKQLIIGLLFSEGVISGIADIEKICPESNENETDEQKIQNSWQVYLSKSKKPELTSIERFHNTYSSCGLCGATSLKALELKNPPNLLALTENQQFSSDNIYKLSDKMRTQQKLFTFTGGVHGAALFNQQAELMSVFEDIGRHNAVDKLIGDKLIEQKSSQVEQLLVMLVSGRVSFEIVQKAVMAGISILVSVGAPSDLAIKASQRFELTLIGFATSQSFNVYSGDWRIEQKV